MKRIAALFLTASLLASLAACGKGGTAPSAGSDSSTAASSEAAETASSVTDTDSQPDSEPASSPASSRQAASSAVPEEENTASSQTLPADTTALKGGPSQVDAMTFPLDQKVQVEVNGSRQWFAFTTGSGTDYGLLLAPEGQYYRTIGFTLYNELGEQVWESGTNEDGSVTVRQIQLSPQTTYYGLLSQRAGNDGSLVFRVSSRLTGQDTAVEVEREPETVSELIFEEPFSLDETQILFVSNKAVFVSEADAKAALAPVAQVILDHPDHPVLLAGTTATDGEQASCVKLSSQRAEAVKNLLVSAYGVPEGQLLTVGLGYEADPFPRGQDRDSRGNFVESEAVKNRRVVVLDASDPIAQEILNT